MTDRRSRDDERERPSREEETNGEKIRRSAPTSCRNRGAAITRSRRRKADGAGQGESVRRESRDVGCHGVSPMPWGIRPAPVASCGAGRLIWTVEVARTDWPQLRAA